MELTKPAETTETLHIPDTRQTPQALKFSSRIHTYPDSLGTSILQVGYHGAMFRIVYP
jgi:hypothetical protein